MRSVSQTVDADDGAGVLHLDDLAPRRPTYDELVARVAAIDERVDLIDRFLFEDEGGDDGPDDGRD
jgi:hypothetical protein